MAKQSAAKQHITPINHSLMIVKIESPYVEFSFELGPSVKPKNLVKLIEKIQEEREKAGLKDPVDVSTLTNLSSGGFYGTNNSRRIWFCGEQKGKSVSIKTRGDVATHEYLRQYLNMPQIHYEYPSTCYEDKPWCRLELPQALRENKL
jgi:hypothetical protein